MRHGCPLFLEDDTIDHLDWIARQLSERRQTTVSRSEAVEWVVRHHWKKVIKQQVKKQHKPLARAVPL